MHSHFEKLKQFRHIESNNVKVFQPSLYFKSHSAPQTHTNLQQRISHCGCYKSGKNNIELNINITFYKNVYFHKFQRIMLRVWGFPSCSRNISPNTYGCPVSHHLYIQSITIRKDHSEEQKRINCALHHSAENIWGPYSTCL